MCHSKKKNLSVRSFPSGEARAAPDERSLGKRHQEGQLNAVTGDSKKEPQQQLLHLPIARSSCHFKLAPRQAGCYVPNREDPYNPQHFKDTLNTHFSYISSVKQVTL